jgi:SAM-dependent methyltransferase
MGLSQLSRSRRESNVLTIGLGFVVVAMAALARDPSWWYGFVGAVIAASILIIALWRRDAITTPQVVALALVFRIAFLPLLPVLSDDAYRYVWDGMLQVHGINPYQYRPAAPELAAFHNEPIFESLNSASYYSVYPPLSQALFALGGLFYDQGWTISYYVIKGLFATLEMGGVLLLAKMIAARDLMLYAWHPLALIEGAGQAHTEAATVFFLIAAVWAVRRSSSLGASLALTAAVWVKLYPVVLIPLLWRRFGWRPAIPVIVFSVVVCLPYASVEVLYHFATSLNLYVQLFEFNAGLYYGVKELFRWVTGADWSKTLGPAFGVIYTAILPAVYWSDARFDWSFATSALLLLGLFFFCSTTVHPWYLLTVLPLAVLFQPPVWGWIWLATCSVCTYLFYIGGPYWSLVAVGWGGAALLFTAAYGDDVLQGLLRWRASLKVGRLRPAFSKLVQGGDGAVQVLDLGSGEGYVGARLAEETGAKVFLADVLDLNRTSLPHVVYDGQTLPYDDAAFDVTVLYFVLHHCEDPGQVLREARRVSKKGVLIVESTYTNKWQGALLHVLDRGANRLRSRRAMDAQEEQLHFRRPDEWRALIRENGGEIHAEHRFGRWWHRQVLFAVR